MHVKSRLVGLLGLVLIPFFVALMLLDNIVCGIIDGLKQFRNEITGRAFSSIDVGYGVKNNVSMIVRGKTLKQRRADRQKYKK